jgi:hypothetical protein
MPNMPSHVTPQLAAAGPPPQPSPPPGPSATPPAVPVPASTPPAPPATPSFIDQAFEPPPAAPRLYLLAALALATGSAFLVHAGVGAGLAALGLGFVVAAFYAAHATTIDAEPAVRRDRLRFAGLCLIPAALLALTPAVRAAGWVVEFAVIALLLLLSISVAAPKTWRELSLAAWVWTIQLIPGPAVVAGGAAKEFAGRRWARLAPVARGLVLAGLLVAVFGALFASADAAFNELLDGLVSFDLTPDAMIERVFIFGLTAALAGAIWLIATKSKQRPAKPATTTLGRTEWLIALGALVALFAAFIALQLATLFGGDDHVLRTAGLTYAEYAREGFGQLLVIAMLTLLVVAAAARYGPAGDRATRVLVGALCLLTIVVLISALRKLGLYETAFGSTRLRLVAHDWLLYLGALLVLLIALGATSRTALLPRAVVALSAVAAIAFVASNPDARVSQRNVERLAQTGQLDTVYLTSLSADAVPGLADMPPAIGACAALELGAWLGEAENEQGTLGYNLARRQGWDQLAKLRAATFYLTKQASDRATPDCARATPRP